MADGIDQLKFDDLSRQKPERPVCITLGRRPQTQGEDLCLLFSIEHFGNWRGGPLGSVQSLVEAALHQPCLLYTSDAADE